MKISNSYESPPPVNSPQLPSRSSTNLCTFATHRPFPPLLADSPRVFSNKIAATTAPPVESRTPRHTMEEELCCPACKQFYNHPVLLPCYHALCLHCAVHLQQPAHQNAAPAAPVTADNAESVASGSSGDYQESDKLSILSETDSGVVCTSRPNSYVGTPNGLLFPSALSLACPQCHKPVYFDENGAHNLPKYRVMQSIVDKYGELRNLTLKCQMCEIEPAKDATVMCEQCEVLYCELCRESCHPSRGPLAKHVLVEPKRCTGGAPKGKEGKCGDHAEETLNMYCLVCKMGVCAVCLMDSRHASHDVQALAVMCKAQKVT